MKNTRRTNRFKTLALIALVIILSLTGYKLYTHNKNRNKQELSEISIQVSKNPYFLQTDKRWAKDKIGGSNETVAQVGCTISCVAMSLTHKGFKVTPKDLNKKLKSARGYTSRGWLKWYTIQKLTNSKFKVYVPRHFNNLLIDKLLLEKKDIIAKIMINGFISHWVLIVGKQSYQYLVKDPLESSKEIIKISKYNSKIYSIRWIEKS